MNFATPVEVAMPSGNGMLKDIDVTMNGTLWAVI